METRVERIHSSILVSTEDSVVAAARAECDVGSYCDVTGFLARPTVHCPHFFVPQHRYVAVASEPGPVDLLAEDSDFRIRFEPPRTINEIFSPSPIRLLAMAHIAMNIFIIVETLLVYRVAIIHNDPPFWLPVFVFLGATNIIHKTTKKSSPNKNISF